jgi:hypothetical protein
VTNATDVDLLDVKVYAREKRRLKQQLDSAISSNLDWRYLEPKIEEHKVELTSGQTMDKFLTNFSDNDLASHVWVLFRTNSLDGSAKDNYLSNVVSTLWFEDNDGNTLTNGINWTSTDLLNRIYPEKLRNLAKDYHGLYMPICAASDPVSDYKEGTMTGAFPLQRNMRVRGLSSVTGTYTMTVIAMCHRRVQLANGQIVKR